jgi:uncharacterized delta-60 repeat protein
VLLRTLIATLALVVLAAPAAWADGEPDPTFDGDGRLASDPTTYDERVTDIAIDAEGRIVVAYNASDPKVLGASKAVVSRYLPDGSIDSGFGSGGTVFVEWLEGPTPTEIVNAVAIDAAGRIVVGGHALMGASSFDHAAARFLPNGKHDTSFSDDGRATFQPPVGGGTDIGKSVAVDSSGRVLLAGYSSSPGVTQFALVRFDVIGEPDKSFSGDGAVLTGFPGSVASEANALALDTSGRPTLAGLVNNLGDNTFGVARYDTSGTLDPSFDGDGLATLGFESMNANASDIEIDSVGRLVLAGGSEGAGKRVGLLGRLLADGGPDPSFGAAGKVVVSQADPVRLPALAIDPLGRLVTAGTLGLDAGQDALMSRFQPDGALDSGFAASGSLLETFGTPTGTAAAVAVDAAGRYVLAGGAFPGEGSLIGLARYNVAYPTTTPPPPPLPVPLCKGKPATVVGTPGRDRLKGTARRDVIAALAGNDSVRGLAGNDLVCAGAGKDLVKAGAGKDLVLGGSGRDRLFGQGGKDRLLGEKGRDTLVGGKGRDVLRGGAGRDVSLQG